MEDGRKSTTVHPILFLDIVLARGGSSSRHTDDIKIGELWFVHIVVQVVLKWIFERLDIEL